MTIAGDVDAILGHYVGAEEAEELTASIFDFLMCGDVISRLQSEGFDTQDITSYLVCMGRLRAIVPNAARKAKVA